MQGTDVLCAGWDPDDSQTMSPQTPFGSLVRKLREDSGLSRRELAERVHCAEVSVRKIEAGERRPSRALAAALAVHLRVSDLDRPAFLALAGARERKKPGRPDRDRGAQRLFGRDAEIDRVCEAVRNGAARPLTITGPGGVGKTSLARAAMSRLGPHVHAAWFVDLSALNEPDLFFETLAEALALPGDVDVPTRIVQRAGDSGLLILDNLEHLPGIAPDVERLLDAAPELAIVVTSRTRLSLDSERVLELHPLRANVHADDAAAPPPAVELFAHRARMADPTFAFDDTSLAVATELCRRLDGLPLAIELVAARVRLMSPQRLLERLIVDGRLQLGLVVDGLGALPERQHNLTHLIDWSYRLLPPTAQAVFRRLSVFNSDFALEAAESVCDPDGRDPIEDVWNTLTILADSHLLEITAEVHESRFRMLETVREFARRQLEADEGVMSARRAHLGFFHRWVADPAGLQRMDQALWIRLLQHEHVNLDAALDTAIALGERQIAADLCLGLFSLWIVRGYFNEALHWGARVLAMPATEPWPVATELKLRNNSAICAQRLYDFDRAFALFNDCLELARAQGDHRWIANLENNLGRLLLDAGRPADAGAYLERACVVYQSVAEQMLGYALVGRGEVLHFAGAYAAAAASFADAAERLDAVGQSDYAAWARLHRIWVQIDSQVDPPDDIDRVSASFDTLGDELGRAAAHLTRARLAWSQGRWEEVERIAGEVQLICSAPAFRWVERETVLLRVDLALLRGRASEADRLLRDADPILSTHAYGCLALAVELRRLAVAVFDEPTGALDDRLAAVRDRLAALGDSSTVSRFFAWFDDVWWAGGGG